VSIGCVWLALKFEPLVGRNVSRIAALAMAISPGFVFYGRYAIHEVWLQLFSMLFILGLLGLWRLGRLNYLWYASMGLAGMILTKETYAIHVACAIIAIPVLAVSIALSRHPKLRIGAPVPDIKSAKQAWTYIDFAMVIIVGVAAIVFFYSGTFFNWSGVKGLYQAFKPWTETGVSGHGHDKPWDYWFKIMGPSWGTETDRGCYELPMLAGLVLCMFCQKFKNLNLRYLAIYGVGTLVAYSIVKYKTPWCVISFGWPFLFIFGAAVVVTPIKFSLKEALIAASICVILAWCAILGWGICQHAELLFVVEMIITAPILILIGLIILLALLSYPIATHVAIVALLLVSLGRSISLNYFRCSSPDERYAYVQTYNDMFKLTRPLLKLAKRDPAYYHLTGHLIRPSAYPLPWVLGDFDRVGYYEGGNMPANLDGDFLLVQQDKIKDVESKLKGAYYTDMITLRNYQDPSKIFFSAKVFKDLFPGKAPDFDGNAPKPAPSPVPAKVP
jgi:predicted membrane-bound mannosyltransferase